VSRQNRVTPVGDLIATPARGTLMGNRGCLHDKRGRIRRLYQTQRWIICRLAFKDRRRTIMAPGRYTELFFLDEATALAAGHRPCAECMRPRFELFRTLWAAANPELAGILKPSAAVLDAVLHGERITADNRKVRFPARLGDLPDGVFVTGDDDRQPFLVLAGQLWPWQPGGYGAPVPAAGATVQVLTPSSVVRTLANGYPVHIHTSAMG
jgi:hypothetical protein